MIEKVLLDDAVAILKEQILFISFYFRASNTITIVRSALGLITVKEFIKMLNSKLLLKTKRNFGPIIKLKYPYGQR